MPIRRSPDGAHHPFFDIDERLKAIVDFEIFRLHLARAVPAVGRVEGRALGVRPREAPARRAALRRVAHRERTEIEECLWLTKTGKKALRTPSGCPISGILPMSKWLRAE